MSCTIGNNRRDSQVFGQSPRQKWQQRDRHRNLKSVSVYAASQDRFGLVHPGS
jgi:hypothetical protein